MSQQTRHKCLVEEWTQRVQAIAGNRWDSEPPVVGDVVVIITYFFDGASLDVDNITKPILDALKGLVYSDDS